MIYIIKTKQLLLALLMSLFTLSVVAGTYSYKADVEGMVCAFCAYSVGKNISKLPGVDAESVNVDLKAGKLIFNTEQKVSQKKLAELFNDSGFSLSNLSYQKTTNNPKNATTKAIFDLKIDVFKVSEFTRVIEAIGDIAASSSSQIIIKAPASQEDTILKPLLMGRQQVVRIRYIAVETDSIQLQLLENL